jgi:hypothetical protein
LFMARLPLWSETNMGLRGAGCCARPHTRRRYMGRRGGFVFASPARAGYGAQDADRSGASRA